MNVTNPSMAVVSLCNKEGTWLMVADSCNLEPMVADSCRLELMVADS